MTALPEAVEQAIKRIVDATEMVHERERVEGQRDVYSMAELKAATREWDRAERALTDAILAYGAARERQGIERAVAEADRIAGCYAAQREATLDEDFLTRYWAAHAVAECVRALPVDGATP